MITTMVGSTSRASTSAADSQHRPEPCPACRTSGTSRNTETNP